MSAPLVCLVLACCGGVAEDQSALARRRTLVGEIVRVDSPARAFTVRATDGAEREVALIDQTQVVDTSGRQRDASSLSVGTHVQITFRASEHEDDVPGATVVTVLPPSGGPESIIEPPESD